MRRVIASLAALLAVTVSALAAASAGALHASGELYGLTDDNRLIGFTTADAGEIESSVKVSGLPAGASLIGIDVRPLDGKLYTVAKVGTTGRLYTLAPETGRATFVATLVAAGATTPIALQGTQFGFDFNPAADALRIVSDTGQNLRALPSSRAAWTGRDDVHRRAAQRRRNDRSGDRRRGIHEQRQRRVDRNDALRHRLAPRRARDPEPAQCGHARPRRRPRCRHHERGRLRHPHRGRLEHRLRVAHSTAGPWRRRSRRSTRSMSPPAQRPPSAGSAVRRR